MLESWGSVIEKRQGGRGFVGFNIAGGLQDCEQQQINEQENVYLKGFLWYDYLPQKILQLKKNGMDRKFGRKMVIRLTTK